MISRREFGRYPLQRKIQMLYEQGTFVTAIRYYSYKVNLYLLKGSYIEVFVNHKHAEIEKVDLLDTAHSRMNFYADQIKLPAELITQ